MPIKTSAARWLGRLILVAAAAGAFWLNVSRAEDLGVFENAPIWVLDAVPVALTHIFAPSNPRYTMSADIADAYFPSPRQPPTSAKDVNAAIAKISRQDVRQGHAGYVLFPLPDDKGIVDFVELAFRTFGLRIESVATAYYALLLLSSSLFCWRYRNDGIAMAALTGVLFAEYQVLPYIVLDVQLASPLALRCMPILSLIACLHCALHYWRRRVSPADMVAVFCQVLIIVFVLHMRSIAVWQPLLLLGFGAVVVFHRWRNRRRDGVARPIGHFSAVLLPALLVIVGMAGLNAYRALALPKEYRSGEQIETRVMWHSIYSGFALQPQLAAEHSLRIDDMSVVADAGRYLKEQGRLDLWKEIGGENPNFSGIKWAPYDLIVRDMLVDVCSKETRYCLESFLIYKPYYFIDALLWYYGLKEIPSVADALVSNYFGDVVKRQLEDTTAKLKQRGLTAAPWGGGFVWMLLALAIGVVLAGVRGGGLGSWSVIASLAVIALASVGPSILGYPTPQGMADSVVAINSALQLGAVAAAALLLRRAADGGFARSFLRPQPRRT